MRPEVPARPRTARMLSLFLASLAIPLVQASAFQQSPSQQKCINALNKNLAKVAKTMGKHVCKCIKLGAKGALGGTIEDCANDTGTFGADKVANAKQKTIDKQNAKCSEAPEFGATNAANVNDVAMTLELDLIHGLLGANLDPAILPSGDPGSRCQRDVARAAKKCQDAKLKAFNRCKKSGLEDGSITEASGLEACMGADPKGKIQKACVDQLGEKISKKCVGVDPVSAFPPYDPNQALPVFVDALVQCNVCRALNDADALERDCDLFDDGLPNQSCEEGSVSMELAIDAKLVSDQLSLPVGLAAPPLDPNDPNAPVRLFVVEQAGRIRLIEDGTLLATPFLSITGLVLSGGERGLLSMAFHPDYATNGLFFVNYTRAGDGDTVVARYQVSGDPDLADLNSAAVVITVAQPFANHNGGNLAFGPDGLLYIGLGDGGAGGDPFNQAQDDTTLLGKMLRIDVDATDQGNYGIPPSNPFTDPNDGVLDEIWAKGLRNPWRYSFDRSMGDLYIGDVGQGDWEEIDFQPAASTGGENWGWRLLEGSSCFNPATNCDPGMLTTLPVYEYPNIGGSAVIGGFVYRGAAIPELQGTYFYSDNKFPSFVRTFEVVGGAAQNHTDRTADLQDAGASLDFVTSMGEDSRGELYIVDGDGELYKIIPEP